MVFLFKPLYLKETLMCYCNTQRGASLYFAFLTITLILGMVLGINALFLEQLKSVRNIGISVLALNGADAGIESIFYDDRAGVNIIAKCPFDSNLCDNILINLGGGLFIRYSIHVFPPSATCAAAHYCAKSTGGTGGNISRAIKILR